MTSNIQSTTSCSRIFPKIWPASMNATVVTCLLLLAVSGCSMSATLDADTANSMTMNVAAAEALKSNQIDDAAFYFFAAQVRYAIDKEVFLPAEKGGNSPGILKAALSASMGPAVLDALANDPDAYARVATRLSAWSPSIAKGYDPGWKYDNRLDEAAAAAIVTARLSAALVTIQAKASLYKDAEYCRLSEQLQQIQQRWRKISETAADLVKQKQKLDDFENERLNYLRKRHEVAAQLKTIEWRLVPEWRWHFVVGWKAEDYFDDPQTQSLCKAIENDDVKEMERLITAGADANSLGKDGMTPLLWAFPDRKLERFECLLKHGADPNVVFESDFGVPPSRSFHPYPHGGQHFEDRGCHAGQSVTFLAARSPMLDYLRTVLAHGGDANFVDRKTRHTPLGLAARANALDGPERVELLVSHNVDLNRYCSYTKSYPVLEAVKHSRYATALSLLKHGADPTLYQPDEVFNTVMFAARKARQRDEQIAQGLEFETPELDRLLAWLEENIGPMDAACEYEKEIERRFSEAVRLEPKDVANLRRKIIAEQEARNERPPATEQ